MIQPYAVEDYMEETMSIKQLFSVLRKRVWLILSITIISIAASAVLSFYILIPIYQTSTQLLVNQARTQENQYNYSDIQTNLQLISTYSVIIKSSVILDLVREDLELKITTNELNEKISVTSEQGSQVVNIIVEDQDSNLAAAIANKTAEIFQKEIINIMSVNNVTVLTTADTTPNQVKPQPILNMAISLVAGLMIGVGLAFLREYLDNTIKSEQDIEKQLNLPVIGVIALMDKKMSFD